MSGQDEATIEIGAVTWRARDGVATITLNRPDRLNAIDHGPGSMQRNVIEALEKADRDPDIRCVIVTGAGRAFSAGGMLHGGARDSAVDWYWFESGNSADNERIRELRKPVIGAINGICYGAALMMAVHFDILIAADTARLGLIEMRFGANGVDLLAYHVGPQWAKFLAFSGDLLSARKAKEIGLVLEVFPEAIFEAKVQDLARRIAAMPPDAVMLNRRVVNSAMDMMGWKQQRLVADALNAVTTSVGKQQRAADGRLFSELMAAGWSEYKQARDAPYTPPWLEDDEESSSSRG